MVFLYILLAVFVFGALIFIHELGHFLVARACRVTVHEFAIGMGPRLVSFCPGKRRAEKKRRAQEADTAALENEFAVDPRPPRPIEGDDAAVTDSEEDNPPYTVYSIRAFPIGGFVSMEGENEDSDDPNALCKKSIWQRMLILVAGPFMNVLLGFILMFVLVCNSVYTTTAIWYNHEGDKAETVYMSEGEDLLQNKDKILKIGNTRVHTGYEVSYEIMYQGHEPLDITVERDGKVLVIEDVVFPTAEESGAVIGMQDFGFYAYSDEIVTVGDRISAAFWRSCSTVKMVWDSLGGLFSGRFGVESVSGAVGVTEVMVDAAKQSVISLLYIVTVISINLGVMNLLPFPALDGGQLMICFVELVIRRPVSEKVKGIINLAGLAVLMLLMLLITVKDVVGLVSRLFGGS